LAAIPEARLYITDLADMAGLEAAMADKDALVHLAADPNSDAPWERVLPSNVVGAYHAFEAARRAGVKRVVYGSSIMASWGYALDEPYKAIFEGRYDKAPTEVPPVLATDPPRPLDLYSGSKVWGEALAHIYAYRHGLSCLCVRLGWVVAEDRPPEAAYGPPVWCSQRDAAQLVARCLLAPADLRYDVFYAVSDNPHRWVDIGHAREVLGYEPQDSAGDWLPERDD
jgi:nucleoside-diphosphate-sugar epimerase